MPLVRYFLLVGGVLLAIIFIVNTLVPKVQVAESGNTKPSVIRIHSDQKWPERIVYDTSPPTIVPAQTANTETNTLAQAATVADVPVKTREAFAQLHPSDAVQLRPPAPKKREVKLQRTRKPAEKRAAPPELLMARHPYFGWFGSGTW